MFAVWVKHVYMQGKNDYNSIHSYYGIVPLLAYLFLRNISVTVRTYYMHALHVFGTITLESYLLQYHIWLADNAGMLLNIIPGYPVLNYCVASSLHIFCAFQMFHVTTELRSIFVPSDVGVALRNIASLCAAVTAACCASIAILRVGMQIEFLVGIVGVIAAAASGALLQKQPEICDETEVMSKAVDVKKLTGSPNSKPMMLLFGVVIVTGGSFLLHAQDFVLQESAIKDVVKVVTPKSLMQLAEGAGLFADSVAVGGSKGFVIGSLAQPWHGLVAVLGILLCVATNDPLFGFARLAQAIFGPNGQKSISWEQAYGPLLEKLGERKRQADSESPTETQPLIPASGASRAAAAY